MRRRMFIAVALTGLAAGIAGLAGPTAGALAASAGPREQPIAAASQATPARTCPFADGSGVPTLEAMRAHMDATHGEGAAERMWGWMGGAGSRPGGMGRMMGAGPAAR